VTPEYAAASCRLFVARAALNALCPNTRVTDAEPGSYEAQWWRPSEKMAAAAISQNSEAEFGSTQGDERWEESLKVSDAARQAECRTHCEILLDLFGDYFGSPGATGAWLPFGPIQDLPDWRPEQWCLLPTPRKLEFRREWMTWNDGTIPRLAQMIYREEAFDRLPVLADALEEAGCTDAAILSHYRQPSRHVRGGWVIDLLLGKS
jgi:hypothetical protein